MSDAKRAIKTVKREAAEKEAWSIAENQYSRLEIVGEQTIKLPFELHATHRVFECGGFVGCLRCGATASCPMSNNRIEKECRGTSTAGAQHRVRRLLGGKLPRNTEAAWPDGSTDPKEFTK